MIRTRFRSRGLLVNTEIYLPNVGVSPNGVFSTKKLVSVYSGNCCRVVRASDSAETDIGFVGNTIDMASAISFAGASELTVKTWYDQSGNGNNATNANASTQPRLRQGNAWRGLQGLTFDGFSQASGGTQITKSLSIPTSLSLDKKNSTAFFVNAPNTSFNVNSVFELGNSTRRLLMFNNIPENNVKIHGGSEESTPTRFNSNRLQRGNPSVNGLDSSSSYCKIYTDTDLYSASPFSISGAITTGGLIGGTVTGNIFAGKQEIFAVVTYPSSLGDANCAQVKAALDTIFGISYSGNVSLVIEGDSISEGTGQSYLQNNVRQIISDLPQNTHVYNIAVHGTTAATEYARAASKLLAVSRTGLDKKIIVIGLGSNDISGGTTAATLWSSYVLPYTQYAQGLGYDVIVSTIIPRGSFTAGQEAERIAYNQIVIANSATYGYSVCDYCSDPVFDSQSDASNTTYYTTDAIHPKTAGYIVMSAILKPVILSLT